MQILVFDIETNGLLEEMTTIHSLVIQNVGTGAMTSHSDHLVIPPYNMEDCIENGLHMLMEADVIVGHNIIRFDIPAIQKIYPWFKPKGIVRDTLVMSNFMYTNMYEKDVVMEKSFAKMGQLWVPAQMRGRHSLEAWGYRLGEWKGDYSKDCKAKGIDPWAEWNTEMQRYCEQDVVVSTKLWRKLSAKAVDDGMDLFTAPPRADAVELEHEVVKIIARQERYGFQFDVAAGARLYAELLQRRTELELGMRSIFAPWYRSKGVVTPTMNRTVKRTDLPFEVTIEREGKNGKALKPYVGPVKEDYHEGSQYSKIALVEFNPTSRFDVADRLQKVRGWKPTEFTADGHPKVDDEVLSAMPWPEAKALCELFLLTKRIGQLAEGNKAWLKVVKASGRIHGRVNTNGANTGRMTHVDPNLAQVPSVGAPFGKQCRSLFIAGPRKVLVGCDADALELCDLAGYMASFDGGAYVDTVLKGDKSNGTDIHTINAQALGCSRDVAKVWFYAFIYGAGDYKLGCILGVEGDQQTISAAGKKSRAKFLKALPALKTLVDLVKVKAKLTGTLKGLDGRILHVRSEHSALNTLLQSAGAIQMKRGLVILDKALQQQGLVPGVHYEFVANIHDEWQIECNEDKAQIVGDTAATAIRMAGEFYSFRCPLSGSAAVGRNWAETH